MTVAKTPLAIKLRSYQVGFGDCFLLSFDYGGKDQRHVLIDFGTTELPKRGKTRVALKPSDHMPKIANLIAQHCDGALTAVVATHRHADHISGFGTDGKTGDSGSTIRALKPRVVIQPWTEDPRAARNATRATTESARSSKGFIAGLGAMHSVAESVLALATHPPTWMSAQLVQQLRFLGLDNIANRSAIDNLMAMGSAKGATAVFAHHGSNAGLGRLLPGVKVHVLGPPTLVQSEKIRKQRARDPDQFWHLLSGPPSMRSMTPLANGMTPARSRAGKRALPTPPEARWFREHLNRLRGQQLLQIVRTLDDQMNNTSVILLFEVGDKKLLFPGDAQIENWSYALQDAPDCEATRALLADVDFYKVGHHGSLNATPKKLLWENFDKRGSKRGKRMKSVLSTLPGKHGHTESNTEVPRRPLLAALQAETDLADTHVLKAADLCLEVDL